MRSIAAQRWPVILLCLLGGVAIGVSGFNSDSNHPTYIPPALHYLDAQYLAKDWWLGSARHYHFAFFALTALLAKLGVLESGLAFLNVPVVAGALYACFLLIEEIAGSRRMTIFAIFIALFLMTRTFYSLGSSYLFTPSLQPSSLAATATLAAILCLLRRRLLPCGLWLAVAGLWHVNFLLVNIPFFATAYLLTVAQEREAWARPRDIAIGLSSLLGPSLLLLACFVPLLLDVGGEALPPAQAAVADWIFFRFAVPFHYYPLSYLGLLCPFLCWQGIGLLWTSQAVSDVRQRHVVWAIQIAFALIIWSATALTTIVFVPTVSRLFLWRLAPFAILFSVLVTLIGTFAAAHRNRADISRADGIMLAISFAMLPTLLVPTTPLLGQLIPFEHIWPAGVILAVLLVRVALRWMFDLSLPLPTRQSAKLWKVVALALLLLAAIAIQPGDGQRSRYSLIVQSQELSDERATFAFIRRTTPRDAMFLTSPDLDYFRLEAERATVVDIKAMPINKSGLILWYRRLRDISGLNRPRDPRHVIAGFRKLDAARIERLRLKYGIAYIVVPIRQTVKADGWRQIYLNRNYRVLAYARAGTAITR